MAERSLRATPEGIKRAQKAFKDQGWTQTQIGEEIGTTRQPVGKFFAGKPIERPNFIDICRLLDLSWEDIAEPEPLEQNQKNTLDIDALVQELREKIKPDIQERCGTMRVLDMSQPIGLKDIYTNVNILEKITGRQRKAIAELLQECKSEDFEHGLGTIKEKRVPGLEAVEKYTKLMILGKPGAGKTTFLKYLAIQCNRGEFQAGRVPIFVTLKDLAEAPNKPGLVKYIAQLVGQAKRLPLEDSKQDTHCRQDACATDIERLLSQGRMLILLDGLDEVREEDSQRVLNEIRNFSDRFRDNHFVITCRIAAREYTFEKFTEVEVADFDNEQISTFATNWFKGKAVKAENFLERLEDNYSTKELATNPLLLTLLCLTFEESGDFPANRSELYKEGLDALLKKWDAKRGIYRDQVYKKLSPQRKEDLLSKIALTTFNQGDYFFKQKAAEQYITDYIRNLPDANIDPEALQLDSEVLLRSIESQHGLLVERAKGIYSFSHLTFHEYFTAREIVVRTQPLEKALQNLVIRITEIRWREVFLLAVGMLQPSADRLLLLMKERVDALVTPDEKLQQFLAWVNQKSLSVQLPYTSASIRAFYFCLDNDIFYSLFLSHPFDLADALGMDDTCNYSLSKKDACVFKNVILLDHFLQLTLDFGCSSSFSPNHALVRGLEDILNHELEPELKQSLERLKDELPNPNQENEGFQVWWTANGQTWGEKLRTVMIKYRNIGHDWQFGWEQREALEQYYDANWLLVECLNSDCYVSREVRQEIEDTLLLPIAEIEKRKQR
jgi:predicted NACHT family NTPase